MTPYIVNLTNHLINVNHYDEIWKLKSDESRFVADVAFGLSLNEVSEMSPQTLGKIMAAFEVGDVVANREELLVNVSFSGNAGDMLRDLVSSCLAVAIAGRLSSDRAPGVPPFRRRSVSV